MTLKQETIDRHLFSKYGERRAYGRLLATDIVDQLSLWSGAEVSQPGGSPFDAMYAINMLLSGVVLAFAEQSAADENQATVDRIVDLYRECLERLARANQWDVRPRKEGSDELEA